MKKISTLAIMAFLFCLSSMAQVVLGDIQFSLGEGKKISPTTGKIVVTFPNVQGVADVTATTFALAGSFNDIEFDGVENTFASGVTFDLQEFELQPATEYALKITSVKVDGVECAAEGGYVLNFRTRGGERKMSWSFVVPDEEMAIIRADADAGGAQAFWSPVAANQRYWVHQSLKDAEIQLDANNVLSVTEDLTFNVGSDKVFIGDPTNSSWSGLLVFNATNLKMTIPDCKVGDVITFAGVNATKGSSSKQTCIYVLNDVALTPEGIQKLNGEDGELVYDSVWVSAKGTFKFEAQVDGDIDFYFSNFRMSSITIEEAQPKLPRNYRIVAGLTTDDNTVELKELLGTTEGTTGSTVKINYPYWVKDAEGNVYTHGSRGSEFVEAFDLKNGEGDTTFVINYSKTAYEGAVYLTEGEDIEGAILCSSPNAVVRSSMGKAAYVAEDTKLITLQPGSYKIRAIIFDATSGLGYNVVLGKGEGEENEIYLTSTLVNFSETESDLLTITEPTDITLKAGGSDLTGLDALLIYASTEDPTGIATVKAADQKGATRKVIKNGQLLIQTAAGTFNVAGVQVK